VSAAEAAAEQAAATATAAAAATTAVTPAMTAAATAIAATVAAEAAEQAPAPATTIAAAAIAASVAARSGAAAARHFALDGASHHAGACDAFLMWNAAAHGAASLVGNAAGHAGHVLLDTRLRDAAGHAHFAGDVAVLGPAGVDLDGARRHRANLTAASDRALLLHHARHPHPAADAVGWCTAGVARVPRIARVAAIAAVMAVAAPVAEAVAKRAERGIDFTALIVAAIDAFGDALGFRDVAVARLHDRTFLTARNPHAHLLAHILPFLDSPDAANGTFTAFLVSLTPISGVLFNALLSGITDFFDSVGLGDAFGHTDRACSRATTATRRIEVSGAGGGSSSHRGDGADQQSDSDGLPYHAFSFVAVLADPPVHG
jgi:hypothetical protein